MRECCAIVLTLSLYTVYKVSYFHTCNPAGVASSSGNMTVVFTLGSLLGVAVLAVIATVVILGVIICLCACRRKQKAKDTSKSVFYTVQIVCGWNGLLECDINCGINTVRVAYGWRSLSVEGMHACLSIYISSMGYLRAMYVM